MSDLINIRIGEIVTLVSARDPDLSANLKFEIDAANSSIDQNAFTPANTALLKADQYFSIEERTGVVRVISALDRETFQFVRLAVTVEDINPANTEIRQMAWRQFTINIQDINDNPPKFNKPAYSATVKENSALGSRVTRVHAKDADEHASLTYRVVDQRAVMTSAAPSGVSVSSIFFQVDQETGIIYVAGQLDYERVKSVNLTVRASDGNGSLEGNNEL